MERRFRMKAKETSFGSNRTAEIKPTFSAASHRPPPGDDVTFAVEISGGPPPFRYTWRKNISQIFASEERTASFTITNAQLADAGNYLVHVTNSISAASSLPAAVLTATNVAAASR